MYGAPTRLLLIFTLYGMSHASLHLLHTLQQNVYIPHLHFCRVFIQKVDDAQRAKVKYSYTLTVTVTTCYRHLSCLYLSCACVWCVCVCVLSTPYAQISNKQASLDIAQRAGVWEGDRVERVLGAWPRRTTLQEGN